MAGNQEFLESAARLLDAVTRLVESSQVVAFIIVLLPSAPGLIARSISGAVVGAGFGFASGMAAAGGLSLWCIILWLIGFVASWVLATKTEMRRDAKQRHSEILQAIQSTTRSSP